MIGTKLFSYKLDDGSMIEFTNAMSGFGRVYVNGEEVSKKRGWGGSESHLFSHNGSEYQLNIWPLLSFHAFGFSIELKKGEERLMLSGKEPGITGWKVFFLALAVGVLLGMLTIFLIES